MESTQSGTPVVLGRVFVVDDEQLLRRAIARALASAGLEVETFESAEQALLALADRGETVDLLLTDVLMSGMTGFELLVEAHSRWPDLAIVLMTGEATVSAAVEAMRLGAYDYLVKPFDLQNALIPAARRAMERKRLFERNRFLESQLEATSRIQGLVGDSAALRHVCSMISAAAPVDVTVLILGESGTGKELVARAIHAQSRRAGRPFVDVNCAALTESLLESELFGHVRGAFTGATTARRGLFEAASGGTLFLDEVGELSPAMQVRLLRVLQESVIRPVGSTESRSVDARILAATNRVLAREVEHGRFRQDLFYRLNVFSIEMPPLRERRDDIPVLVHHFLEKHATRLARPKPGVMPGALEALTRHDWPGNVRELENVCERALVLCRGERIGVELLPGSIGGNSPAPALNTTHPLPPLVEARDDFIRRYIEQVMLAAHGNLAEGARLAGMERSNFRRLVRRVGHGNGGED